MDIQNFIDEFKQTFVYDMLSQTLADDQIFDHFVGKNGEIIWSREQMRQIWKFAKSQVLDGFVLVDKKHTEDWYLDDHEIMWWDVDGIDNWLCDLYPGQVQAVEHKEYLITESNTLYAVKVWDESNDQVGFWEFFKTKDEAEKAAAHCKAKFWEEDSQEQAHD